MKQCPDCKKKVKNADTVCKYCSYSFIEKINLDKKTIESLSSEERDFITMLNTLDIHCVKFVKLDKNRLYEKEQKKNIVKITSLKDSYLYEEWSTGGTSGGSCWSDNDDRYSYSSDEQEPDLLGLDTILMAINPNISYLQYRAIMRDLVEYDSWSKNEYYGNSTNYSSKRINLQKLFDRLKEVVL